MQRYSNFILIILLLAFQSIQAQENLTRLDTVLMLENLRKLSHDNAEGRRTGTNGAEAARRFIIKQMETLGVKSLNKGYRHDFTFQNRQGKTIRGENVIGYIKGEVQEAIVITAHYDHLGVRNGQVYNGADDNASGVAALIAMMAYFKRNDPKHTIVFAALDAEEMGLQGAKAFLEDERVPQDQLRYNINMDMISINDKNELYVAGTHHYPELKPLVEQVSALPIQLKIGHDSPDLGKEDWTYQSDHGAFHRRGIPFLYFGVEDHPHYHQISDTYENINRMFYIRSAHAILDVILLLDEY